MERTSEYPTGTGAFDPGGVPVPALHGPAAQQWENFARAQELGQIGWWRLDTRSNVLTWSEENYRIFGAPSGEPQTYQTFLESVHPDDRSAVDEQWRAALLGQPYDIEHRIVANGQVKWVREKATLEFDEAGAVRGAFGVMPKCTGVRSLP